MLEQFIKSVLANFVKIEPMNAYIQNIPVGVQYPCYLVNKCDIKTEPITSFYYMNNITLYIRMFGNSELELKNKAFNIIQYVFQNNRKVPILNENGTESGRFIRIEDIESIEINVDENDVYCVELSFTFDTTHNVKLQEFEILGTVYSNTEYMNP